MAIVWRDKLEESISLSGKLSILNEQIDQSRQSWLADQSGQTVLSKGRSQWSITGAFHRDGEESCSRTAKMRVLTQVNVLGPKIRIKIWEKKNNKRHLINEQTKQTDSTTTEEQDNHNRCNRRKERQRWTFWIPLQIQHQQFHNGWIRLQKNVL